MEVADSSNHSWLQFRRLHHQWLSGSISNNNRSMIEGSSSQTQTKPNPEYQIWLVGFFHQSLRKLILKSVRSLHPLLLINYAPLLNCCLAYNQKLGWCSWNCNYSQQKRRPWRFQIIIVRWKGYLTMWFWQDMICLQMSL